MIPDDEPRHPPGDDGEAPMRGLHRNLTRIGLGREPTRDEIARAERVYDRAWDLFDSAITRSEIVLEGDAYPDGQETTRDAHERLVCALRRVLPGAFIRTEWTPVEPATRVHVSGAGVSA